MATKANLVIDQGTTFSTDLSLQDKNGDPLSLGGFTANSVIKKWYTSQTSVPFNVSINTASGTITLELDASTSANLYAGRYVYDVDITETATGTVSRVVEGIITVTPSVTAGIFSTNNTWFANGYTNG
jgi:hypothetical protein